MKNPFILSPYTDKSLFCDRESELKTLFDYVTNEANVTLISPRRMGKTGLIYRLSTKFQHKNSTLKHFTLTFMPHNLSTSS
jgi:hypothetical protein